MQDSRILISPNTNIEIESLKTTLPDGGVINAELEYKKEKIKLGSHTYEVFIGSTAGKKGLPNQDYAGLAQLNVNIEATTCECLLMVVADGVSSKELSEKTSESIVATTIENFAKNTREYSAFTLLANDLRKWIAQGANSAAAPSGASTVSAFLFVAHGDETRGIAINCGDSRVFWATPKYVESAKVHVEVLNPRNAISYALGADRDNEKVHKDVYFVENPVEVFLCTDTYAYLFDGVHFPEELIPSFGTGIGSLRDHLTAISFKRI